MVRLCALLVLLAACGGAGLPVHKGKDDYLAALRIEGNKAISTSFLLPRLALSGALNKRSIDEYNLLLDTDFTEAHDEEDVHQMMKCAAVLCWVLRHDHYPQFADLLTGIEADLAAQGIEVRKYS